TSEAPVYVRAALESTGGTLPTRLYVRAISNCSGPTAKRKATRISLESSVMRFVGCEAPGTVPDPNRAYTMASMSDDFPAPVGPTTAASRQSSGNATVVVVR